MYQTIDISGQHVLCFGPNINVSKLHNIENINQFFLYIINVVIDDYKEEYYFAMTDKLVTLLVTGLMFCFVIPFALIFTILYILYGLLVFPILKYLDHKYEDTVICENDDSLL